MFDFLFPKIPQVTAQDVKNAIDSHEDYVLLDVRTPEEFTKGHINGSINVPLDKLRNAVERTVADKNKKIYVYCFSGSRSAQAVAAMVQLGYKNVFDMKSGMLAWRANKYPEKQ